MSRKLFAVGLLALLALVVGCSNSPHYFTTHGTVKLTSVNGVPPAQAYPDIQNNLTVNIVADDGPGNYAGQPWNEASTDMTLQSSTPQVITYTFTAQVPDDGVLYQISAICCFMQGEPLQGENFTLEEMQQGPVLCIGDNCGAL